MTTHRDVKGRAALSPLERVRRLNPHAVASDGALKPFSQQYGEYMFAKNSGERDLDVIIKPALQAGKTFYTNEGTGEWLSAQGNRFSMGDPSISEGVPQRLPQIYSTQPSSRSQAAAQILAAVAIDANTDTVEVAPIRSVHGNSHLFSDMIESTARGRGVYVNERTGAWLELQQHSGLTPTVVLQRHLLDFHHTHLGRGRAEIERPRGGMTPRGRDGKGVPARPRPSGAADPMGPHSSR